MLTAPLCCQVLKRRRCLKSSAPQTARRAARSFPGPLPRWDESGERAHRRTRRSLARPPPGLHGLTGKKTGRETGSSTRLKSPEMPAVKRRADDIHVPSPDVRHRKRLQRRDATPPPEATSRGCGQLPRCPPSLAGSWDGPP